MESSHSETHDRDNGTSIHRRVLQLGDIGLAVLVSRIAEEHCLIYTPTNSDLIEPLLEEIRLTCTKTLGLPSAWIQCSPDTTVDMFNNAILVEPDDEDADFTVRSNSIAKPLVSARERSPSRFGSLSDSLDNRRISDVIVAINLDLADESVQVQMLELLRTRRIFTRSSMHVAPKDLLVIAVLSKPMARLTHHLNDLFAISHTHDDADPFSEFGVPSSPAFTREDMAFLRESKDRITITAEIAQYLHNVVVFMRASRYIKAGVTATATRQLRTIVRTLAPLHGLDFIPPSLVVLAVRKIYPHRLILATAETEKSLQWESDPVAVRELLDGMTVEDAIEEVLASVEAPV